MQETKICQLLTKKDLDWTRLHPIGFTQIGDVEIGRKDFRRFIDREFNSVCKKAQELNFVKVTKKQLADANDAFYFKMKELFEINNGIIGWSEVKELQNILRIPDIEGLNSLEKGQRRKAVKQFVSIYIKGEYVELD